MLSSRFHRVLLIGSGLLCAGIGTAILFAPVLFHSTSGIDLGNNPSLMSEVRAQGGTLLALGVVILAGGLVPGITRISTALAATVYLAIGGSRLLSLLLDGWPGSSLIAATIIELTIGAACAWALVRSQQTDWTPLPFACRTPRAEGGRA